jgi:hypothetical protein
MAAPASSAPERAPLIAGVGQMVLLALWIGAAGFFAAVVAPAAFDVLPTREDAGALVGRALPVIFVAGIVVGLAAFALEFAGRRRSWMPARSAAVATVAAACAVAQLGIAPRIAALRDALRAPLAVLALDDPQRIAFGRLHMMSVAALGVAILASLAALALAASTLRTRGPR